MPSAINLTDLNAVAHVIQIALTPIFLLSAMATLLGVFSTRLARVADQVDRLVADLENATAAQTDAIEKRLAFLRRRSHALDIAVVLGGCSGIATCLATLILFVGALRDRATAAILFACFAAGLLCTVGALGAFVTEMLLASRGLRRRT